MTELILASASPYRYNLLQRLHIPFRAAAQDIDESLRDGESAADLTQRLAQEKALCCANGNTGVIIGSDQVGEVDGRILLQPGNYEKAAQQLAWCSGEQVRFYTSVYVFETASKRSVAFTDVSAVTFRALSQKQIDYYLHTEKPYKSCGSFQAEGLGISLVQSIHCDDPTAITGLPLIRLSASLREFGIDVLRDSAASVS